MPLLEQHVGHPVVVRVDQEALDPMITRLTLPPGPFS